jgi:hypothetical protein
MICCLPVKRFGQFQRAFNRLGTRVGKIYRLQIFRKYAIPASLQTLPAAFAHTRRKPSGAYIYQPAV